MFCAGVRHRLATVHALVSEGGSEASPHAHEYLVQWSCARPRLDEKGYSVDISLLKSCLAAVCASLEGSDLNSLPFFASRPPSVENLAVFLAGELRRALGASAAGITRCELTIWEADDAWASYAQDWDRG